MAMRDVLDVVVCGRGGQGILFSTAVLQNAAMRLGRDFIGSETHGMAQRGGSVVGHLRIGPARGPLVCSARARALISLDAVEAARNVHFLARGGACFVNMPEGTPLEPAAASFLASMDCTLFALDADRLAREAGMPFAANAALLGLIPHWDGLPFDAESLEWAIRTTGSAKLRDGNLIVFKKTLALQISAKPS